MVVRNELALAASVALSLRESIQRGPRDRNLCSSCVPEIHARLSNKDQEAVTNLDMKVNNRQHWWLEGHIRLRKKEIKCLTNESVEQENTDDDI